MELYDKKIIISGNVVEIYEYGEPQLKGYQTEKKGRSGVAGDMEKVNNRQKVLNRASRDLKRLVNANVDQYDFKGKPILPKFFTLTFSEEIQDFKTANREFSKFIQRLNYQVFGEKKAQLKYVVVPEIQKERLKKFGVAVWHYHTMFFNLPYIDKHLIKKIWGNGVTWIEAIKSVGNCGAYVSKYMTKFEEQERLIGQKCYFSSRGLLKPKEITDKKIVESLADSLLSCGKITYENTFKNDYTGEVKYCQIDVKNSINAD